MNEKFKTCARGHYYSAELDHCPYCPSNNVSNNNFSPEATMGPTDDSNRTVDVSGLGMGQAPGDYQPTKDINQSGFGSSEANGETKTSIISGVGVDSGKTQTAPGKAPQFPVTPLSERTMIVDDEGVDEQGHQQITLRNRRKLVGWLVSYTLDGMGMDFKLYEGRNIIGRNADCQITIADKTVSGEHAVILFRAGKYSIKDQQSAQGTFVNEEDIELDPRYLKDGDVIRMGQTILKFRSSL